MILRTFLAVVGFACSAWLLVGAVVAVLYLRYCRAVAATGSRETKLYVAELSRYPGSALLFMCVVAILWPEPFWEMVWGANR